mgnify:CR=1 FL=1
MDDQTLRRGPDKRVPPSDESVCKRNWRGMLVMPAEFGWMQRCAADATSGSLRRTQDQPAKKLQVQSWPTPQLLPLRLQKTEVLQNDLRIGGELSDLFRNNCPFGCTCRQKFSLKNTIFLPTMSPSSQFSFAFTNGHGETSSKTDGLFPTHEVAKHPRRYFLTATIRMPYRFSFTCGMVLRQ